MTIPINSTKKSIFSNNPKSKKQQQHTLNQLFFKRPLMDIGYAFIITLGKTALVLSAGRKAEKIPESYLLNSPGVSFKIRYSKVLNALHC